MKVATIKYQPNICNRNYVVYQRGVKPTMHSTHEKAFEAALQRAFDDENIDLILFDDVKNKAWRSHDKA